MVRSAAPGGQTRRVSIPPPQRRRLVHPAWIVAAVAFLALVGAAGFRAAPSALMVPLEDEFGWTRTELSLAVTVNLVLFGLTAPFAAALMARLVRRWDDGRAGGAAGRTGRATAPCRAASSARAGCG